MIGWEIQYEEADVDCFGVLFVVKNGLVSQMLKQITGHVKDCG